MNTNTKDILLLIETAVTAQFPTLSGQFCAENEFLHLWKYSSTGIKYLPNFHLIFEADGFGNVIARLLSYHGKTIDTISISATGRLISQDLVQFVSDFESETNMCHGIVQTNKDTTLQEKSKLKPLQEGLLEFFNDEIVSRSANCTIRLTEGAQMCSECTKLATDSVSILKVKLECPETDSKHLLEPTIFDEDIDVDDFNDNEDVTNPEDELKTEEDILSSLKKDPDYEQETTEVKIKRGRGRPRKLDKKPPKTIGRINRAPKVRCAEEENERETDRVNGYRGTCEVCLKTYNSRSTRKDDLNRHKKYFTLEGSVSCPLCKEDIAKMSLTSHFQEKHSPNTCCLVCLEVMPNVDKQLRNHILKTHQIKPVCHLCGKSAYSAYWLEIHMNSIHSQIRDVFCHRCGKTFAHKVLLNKHLRVTCGSEEWKCPLCPKIFDTKKKIHYHLKVHCGEKPYVCPLCTYASYKMENMLLHSRKVHHLKGCKDDYFVDEDILKKQKTFIDIHIEIAKPVKK